MSIKRPCPDCPFRQDAPRHPWRQDLQDLFRTASGDHFNVFACHTAPPMACAGWKAAVGVRAPGLRALIAAGRESPTVDTSGLVLFTFEEMVKANQLDLGLVGPCCVCGRRDALLALREVLRRLPEGKKGWRCIECGVEQGAFAVLCRDCLEQEPLWVCEEDPAAEARLWAVTLEPLEHREGCSVGHRDEE